MRVKYAKYYCITIFLALGFTIKSVNINDRILKVGTEDGVGPLNMNGINARILGTSYISNDTNPDIFVMTDHLNPDFSLYECIGRSENDVPVFSYKGKIRIPETLLSNSPASILQVDDGTIYLIWYADTKIHRAIFNKSQFSFAEEISIDFPSTVYPPKSLYATLTGENNLKVIVSIPSSEFTLPPENPNQDNYVPYLKSGIWRGKINKTGLYEIIYPGILGNNSSDILRLISPTSSEIYLDYMNICEIELKQDNEKELIAGSYFGAIYYYGKSEKQSQLTKRMHIVDNEDIAHRFPGVQVAPISYPDKNGNYCDIIATGEGGMYYYKFAKIFNKLEKPVFENPTPVLEKNANLHAGTLPVPTIIDFDQDGVLDLVVGNSQGFINFFKNRGTNLSPLFLPGKPIKANGNIINIQPGYGESIQGPIDSRRGYVGPNVIDWDRDGYLDILINDSRGKHMLYKGVANEGDFRFMGEVPLFCKGLELRGTWRCRPGVGLLNGRMAYITLDDDNHFHIYWRVDDQNLDDGGKLKLSDGSFISGTDLYSVETGKLRFEIVDWDNDGVKDLILGVSKWHSVPNATVGLPNKQPVNGVTAAGVLFMKNVGTEAEPSYEFPKQITYNGQVIQTGVRETGVSTGMLGVIENNMPNLLIVDERSRFYLINHSDINPECQIPNDIPGIVIDKTPSTLSPEYFTSPSLTMSSDGTLFSAYVQNKLNGNETIIKKSDNRGETWINLAKLNYGANGSIFELNNQLFIIGSSNNVENCVVIKSEDKGYNWTTPSSISTGLIQNSTSTNRIITNSSKPIVINNRIFKLAEQIDQNNVRRVGVMSALFSSDLLRRTSWTFSNYLSLPDELGQIDWKDGSLAEINGKLNGLICIKGGSGDRVVKINIALDGKLIAFDTIPVLIDMPGGDKKFTIIHDKTLSKYWAITNMVKNDSSQLQIPKYQLYNNLTLLSSQNLIDWQFEQEILSTPENTRGFLYSDWILDNDMIIGASCTSWNDCKGDIINVERPNFIIKISKKISK